MCDEYWFQIYTDVMRLILLLLYYFDTVKLFHFLYV